MRSLSSLLLVVGCAAWAACGLGDASGGDGDGDGDFQAPTADAIPSEGIVCSSSYTVTGDVTHDVIPGEGCDGSGTWSITVSDPTGNEEHEACGDAPGTESFSLRLTRVEGRVYTAADQEDSSRSWTAEVRDKGGSCSATFGLDLGGGASWSLVPSEDGPDGPLDGSAHFERRE